MHFLSRQSQFELFERTGVGPSTLAGCVTPLDIYFLKVSVSVTSDENLVCFQVYVVECTRGLGGTMSGTVNAQ